MIHQTAEETSTLEAVAAFEREIGVTGVPFEKSLVGNREFIKFLIGREAPLYTYALHACQRSLSDQNFYKGAISLSPQRIQSFTNSIEASALLTLLTRSTREVVQGAVPEGYSVPYVPFQKREDHQLAQPASHIVRGRRGVGKSTLIRRATELLGQSNSVVGILDMQAYTTMMGEELIREVLYDACTSLSFAAREKSALLKKKKIDLSDIDSAAAGISDGTITNERAPVVVKRCLARISKEIGGSVFVFLDDFHLVARQTQPKLLGVLNACLKGANGWLKVAGVSSLLNVYDPAERVGLQVPGDAQYISLDLTLENPEAAEAHLRAIAEGFLKAVGYSLNSSVIPERAFRRLAWANAGVPRDFLQMLARSLEHANRNRHASITLSDVNMAIGEFGQQKMDDLQRDARNESENLREALAKLESLCLDESKINAFLVRADNSRERAIIQILSDLRMVHLIHQSITPRKAGERFEAFILDYSLFTGFCRRPNIKEMIPNEAQFRAAELRALPKVPDAFFAVV